MVTPHRDLSPQRMLPASSGRGQTCTKVQAENRPTARYAGLLSVARYGCTGQAKNRGLGMDGWVTFQISWQRNEDLRREAEIGRLARALRKESPGGCRSAGGKG